MPINCPLVLRTIKGSKLTFNELDGNFLNLRSCLYQLESQITTQDTFVTGGTYNSITTSLDFDGTVGFTPFSVDVSSLTGSTETPNLVWSGGSSGNYSVKQITDTTTNATADYAVATNRNTLASGVASFAGGTSTTASGDNSSTFGDGNTASTTCSFAIGKNTNSSGTSSFTMGRGTSSSGSNSYAGGSGTIVTGNNSFIHSNSSLLTGLNSVLLGGEDLTGTTDNTVFVPYLNINNVDVGTPINNLAVDSDGKVIIGTNGNNVFVNSGNANVATQQLTFTNTTGGTFNVTNAAALYSDNDINVTGGTYNPSNGCVTFSTNSGSTFDVCGFVTGLTDTFITGATLVGTVLELERNNGLSDVTVDLSPLSGISENNFVTGGTFNSGSGTLSLFNNNGDTFNVTGFTSGGGGGGVITTKNILHGLITNFASGSNPEFVDWSGILSPTGTHNSSLPIPFDLTIKRITLKYLDTTTASVDATFNYEVSIGKLNNPNGSSENTNYVDLTGGANVLTLTNANVNGTHFLLETSGLSINVSAGDVLVIRGNITAGSNTGGSNEEVMVSVEYEKNYTTTGGGGGGVDTFVTGATLNGTDLEIDRNQGEPQIIVDLSSLASDNNVFVNSGNADFATQQLTFTNTTGGTFNVTNAAALYSDNDINVTGGTYDLVTGCVTFGTNSGTTFDVCGFISGFTDTFTTGATYDNTTGELTFTKSDSSTYDVDLGIVSNVTGFTYLNNNFTISQNSGLSDLVSNISVMTGLTVNGQTTMSGDNQNLLSIIGSGGTEPLLTVEGSNGELFSISDNLIGSLFSVSDISGLPILEVYDDDTVHIGNYQAPCLNTTVKTSYSVAGPKTIYSVPISAYTGAFFDYTVSNPLGVRAGTIMSIWSGSTVEYRENVTNDIGSTTPLTFEVTSDGSEASLIGTLTGVTTGWVVKTIVRSI